MPDLPALVSVHGINTTGEWQATLRPVFAPHFRYCAIHYPHYRWLGGTKVVVEPWFLGGIVLAATVAVLAGVDRPNGALLGALIVAAVIAAYLMAGIRRRRAFVRVLKQFDAHVRVGELPYGVAHSFGTYLTGRLLLERPTMRCSRLIFAGSVLARDFPSTLLRGRNRMPFEELRNETGLGDLVVKAAGLAQGLVRHLGNAGLRGFSPLEGRVHEVASPDQSCATCHTPTPGPRPGWMIHNVRIKAFAHSDQFITPRHAVQFWLPFLWSIDVPEFGEWLELCILASYAGRASVYGHEAIEAEQRILERRWGWAGMTLRDFVCSEYPAAAPIMGDPVQSLRIYRALWLAVARAAEHAESHGEDPVLMAHARALDPRVAVQVAVGVVVP